MIPFAEYFHELMTVVLRSSETKEVERSYTIYLYRGVCVGPEMSYERKISPGFTLKDCRNCETKVVWFFACPSVYRTKYKFSRTFAVTGMRIDKI